MTREEIAKSLKPLEWRVWDDYGCRFAQPTKAHEAMIMAIPDGRMLVRINRYGEIIAEVLTTFNTLQEAKDFVREWQIDRFCSYFKVND